MHSTQGATSAIKTHRVLRTREQVHNTNNLFAEITFCFLFLEGFRGGPKYPSAPSCTTQKPSKENTKPEKNTYSYAIPSGHVSLSVEAL